MTLDDSKNVSNNTHDNGHDFSRKTSVASHTSMLHKELFEVGLDNVEFRSAGKRVQSEQEEHPSVAHDLKGRIKHRLRTGTAHGGRALHGGSRLAEGGG